MPHRKKKIIKNIRSYIKKGGGNPSDWYVGIAKKPREMLFNHHNLTGNDGCICMHVDSQQMTREVCDYLVNVLGTDGRYPAQADHDRDADMVYAYKKAVHTIP